MLLFYKPIRGSSGAMHSCMFLSMVDTLLGRFAYFIFHLSARPFLGSVGKVDPPTVCFLPRQAWSASAHVFFFTRCISAPFIYACTGFSAMSDLDNRLRDPLCSLGSLYFSMSPTFLEGGSEMVSKSFQFLLRELAYLSHMISSGIYALVASYLTVWPLVWRCYFWEILLVTQIPMMKGGMKFLEGVLCSVLGSILLAFFSSRLMTYKVLMDFR